MSLNSGVGKYTNVTFKTDESLPVYGDIHDIIHKFHDRKSSPIVYIIIIDSWCIYYKEWNL